MPHPIRAGFLGFCLLISSAAQAQSNLPLSPLGAKWPTDSITTRLRTTLAAFLKVRDDATARAPYLWAPAALETAALLDELSGLERDADQPALAYRFYLTNVVRLDSANYLVQLAALGQQKTTPLLRATCELRAKRQAGGRFAFYSPLTHNTAAWPVRQFGTVRFHYPTGLDERAAKSYAALAGAFDKKLLNKESQTDLYLCDNLPAALQALGLSYKADYGTAAHNTLSARQPGRLLLVSGDEGPDLYDPHDLWHRQLRNVVPIANINKPVDEGCAYLYGGSWGVSWPEILRLFVQQARQYPNTDWAATYEELINYGPDPKRPLITTYVVNALLLQKIEREQGFGAVRLLLSCGKYQKGNDYYWHTLEQVAGLRRADYNAAVWALIKSQPTWAEAKR